MSPIADMLIRIKNAQSVHAERILLPSSKVKLRIANILKASGYLTDVDIRKKKLKKAEFEYIDLGLSYHDNQPAINGIKIISRPSRHIYVQAKDIKPVRSGFGIAVVSTSKGIMTSAEARKSGLGGEMLFEIW